VLSESSNAQAGAPTDRSPAASGDGVGSNAYEGHTAPAERLAREARLVKDGVIALRSGDAAHALALFDEHARTYPNGVLADDRAVERVIALCDLGRLAEARAAAHDFLTSKPSSPLAARMRASCGGASNP